MKLDRNCEPWFVAADVCRALDMDTSRGATRYLTGLDADEVTLGNVEGMRGASPALVSESGLYALVTKSRKPEAQRFRKWVTSEVLPAQLCAAGHPQDGQLLGAPRPGPRAGAAAPAGHQAGPRPGRHGPERDRAPAPGGAEH